MAGLVEQQRPVIYFHSHEKFYLSSVDYYLENADLKIGDDIVLTAPITQEQLYNYSLAHDTHGAKLHPRGPGRRAGQPDTPVCYAYVKEYPDRPDHLYITYVFFYCYNDSFKVLHMIPVGAHDADVEHFTVEISKQTEQVTRYYFAAHGYADGGWYFPHEIDYEEDATGNLRPVIYVSKISHGSYARTGIVSANYGFANDWMRKDVRINPEVILIRDQQDPLFDPNQSWIYYQGRMGPDGIWSVSKQQWYTQLEDHDNRPKFASPFQHAVLTLLS